MDISTTSASTSRFSLLDTRACIASYVTFNVSILLDTLFPSPFPLISCLVQKKSIGFNKLFIQENNICIRIRKFELGEGDQKFEKSGVEECRESNGYIVNIYNSSKYSPSESKFFKYLRVLLLVVRHVCWWSRYCNTQTKPPINTTNFIHPRDDILLLSRLLEMLSNYDYYHVHEGRRKRTIGSSLSTFPADKFTKQLGVRTSRARRGERNIGPIYFSRIERKLIEKKRRKKVKRKDESARVTIRSSVSFFPGGDAVEHGRGALIRKKILKQTSRGVKKRERRREGERERKEGGRRA